MSPRPSDHRHPSIVRLARLAELDRIVSEAQAKKVKPPIDRTDVVRLFPESDDAADAASEDSEEDTRRGLGQIAG
ncbi:MAG TPA: hypothetical protein VGS21_08435 [Acidimicrobiales bacterium]|nr:hypothetical protein [Acidimicrobiales bacterium]